MGSGAINTRANGAPPFITQSWFNDIVDALCTQIVPRNSTTGTATDLAGSLGTSTSRWNRSSIECDMSLGDLKIHHSYNNTAPAGEGWMLCDGRQVNQVNYDAEHGAGAWALYIQTTLMQDKYLPDYRAKYLVGVAATSQNGTAPITSIGNAGHLASFAHSHQWNKYNSGAGVAHQTFNLNNTLLNYQTPIGGTGSAIGIQTSGTSNINYMGSDAYTNQALTTPKSIQPDSIEFLIYMRVI